jgi:hypothetical protein
MQEKLVFQQDSVSLYACGETAVEPRIRVEAGGREWTLDRADAERLCLHILAHGVGELRLSKMFLTDDPESEGFILAFLSGFAAMTKTGYLRQCVLDEREREKYKGLTLLPTDEEFAVELWKLSYLDAQRMALAVLEGIDRQSWIPALSPTVGRLKPKVTPSVSKALKLWATAIISSLFCIGIAALTLLAINLVIEHLLKGFPIAPIVYAPTDILLVAILLMLMIQLPRYIEELLRGLFYFR